MLNLCARCSRPLKEGDTVKFIGYSIYHELKSHTVYAIDKPHEVDQDSLQHMDCGRPNEG